MNINIQEKMKELFGNSCLGYCYAYIFTGFREIKLLTQSFLNGWFYGFIDDDGFVSKPVEYINMLSNKKVCRDIENIPLNDLKDLPEGGLFAVEYLYRGKSHFVVVWAEEKKIVFDPSYPSNSVRYGKPISYRRIIQ